MSLPPLQEQIDLTVQDVVTGHYSSLDIDNVENAYWIASHVLKGDVLTETRGLQERAGPGDVMLHPPRLPFGERGTGPGTHQVIYFHAQSAARIDLLRLHPLPAIVHLADAGEYARIFRRLEASWRGPTGPVRDLRAFALTLDLLGLIMEGWERMGRPPRPPALHMPEDRFAQLVAHLDAHLGEKWTRDALAARVHLHPGSFDRAFRAVYGMAPMQMLRDLRLRRARHLLETTDETLDTLAARCGLGDAASLSRAFRARFGLAPGRIRQQARALSHISVYPFGDA